MQCNFHTCNVQFIFFMFQEQIPEWTFNKINISKYVREQIKWIALFEWSIVHSTLKCFDLLIQTACCPFFAPIFYLIESFDAGICSAVWVYSTIPLNLFYVNFISQNYHKVLEIFFSLQQQTSTFIQTLWNADPDRENELCVLRTRRTRRIQTTSANFSCFFNE